MNTRKNLIVLVALVGFLALSSACGSAETTVETAPTPTPVVETGEEKIDDVITTLVQNLQDDTCNLSWLGIAGIIDPEKRLKALENCTPEEEDIDLYNEMIANAQSKLTASE